MLDEKDIIHLKFKIAAYDEEMLRIEIAQVMEDMSTLGEVAAIFRKELQRRYFKSKKKNE